MRDSSFALSPAASAAVGAVAYHHLEDGRIRVSVEHAGQRRVSPAFKSVAARSLGEGLRHIGQMKRRVFEEWEAA